MAFRVRELPVNAKLSKEAALRAIDTALPHSQVQAVVANLGVASQRERKLPAELTVLLVVAMELFALDSLSQVLAKLLKGLRFISPDHDFVAASKGAICRARYRLGARPVVELFRRTCRPIATPATLGAYLFGLRLVGLDSTIENVPDSPENDRAFGRSRTDRGSSAFPQVKAVYLIELGTHVVFDAGFWPVLTNDHPCGMRLLRSIGPGMLVLWDCGFYSYEMVKSALSRGAQVLARVPSHLKLVPIAQAHDGSYYAYIYPDDRRRRHRGEHLMVRVIEYTLTDPNRPGYGERHRLITSLLDDRRCPALELACCYHERWECEVVIDEADSHQRLADHPLRSRKPVGVIQEFYGLLIAHYAIRKLMHEAALEATLDPDRLSFTNALQVVREAISEFQMVQPEQRSMLYQRLLRDIARHQLPPRANRVNPRVVKRKMSRFQVKRSYHRKWPQPTMPFREAVAILK